MEKKSFNSQHRRPYPTDGHEQTSLWLTNTTGSQAAEKEHENEK